MSNPTSNFNWQMPTNTDLVTDLPADFEVFGQAVDTTMADLKGGTTGQILSKTTNADMDFTWINNDQGDISAVNVTYPITGGGTSGAVTVGIQSASTSQSGAVQLSDSTSTTSSVLAATPTAVKSAYDLANAAISKSTVTAKGSIVAATASSTPANLSVGNNGESLVADSSATAGLRWQGSQAAGKNAIINGNFDIWQRGTSISTSGSFPYGADRWCMNYSGSSTMSQQTTGAPNGSRYIARFTTNGSFVVYAVQTIETLQVAPLQGNTITVSVKLRRSANMPSDLQLQISKSATVDAATSSSFTQIASTTATNANLPTGTGSANWLTISASVAIPNDGTANTLQIQVVQVSNGVNTSYWEMSQCQAEIGSVATTFTRAGGTIQGELAACQRYYERFYSELSVGTFGYGRQYSADYLQVSMPFQVTKRIAPTAIDTSAMNTFAWQYQTTSANTPASIVINQTTSKIGQILINKSAAFGTAGGIYEVQGNATTAAYIGYSAEL